MYRLGRIEKLILLLLQREQDSDSTNSLDLIVYRMYLLSRLLKEDFGFYPIYYSVWSRDVEHSLKKLFCDKLVSTKATKKHTRKFVLTDLGKQAISTIIETERILLERKVKQAYENSADATSIYYDVSVITDFLLHKLGSQVGEYIIFKYLEALGWSISLKQFRYMKKVILGNSGIRYKEKIEVNRKN